jgi:endo-1,3-1,4-beta-glycanase ExoK
MINSTFALNSILADGNVVRLRWGRKTENPAAATPAETKPEVKPEPVPQTIAPAKPARVERSGALITWKPTLAQEMNGDDENWEKRYGENGNPFRTAFLPENISFQNGVMSLRLNARTSGEYRTIDKYGYGYYEARIKFASGSGLVSGSFFTFTGTYGKPDHHEIDVEPLGKDCTEIQTNYYTRGQGHHEELVPLGFDGCAAFHNYGFKWAPKELVFYVDGKAVRTITDNSVPTREGQIMANIWAGTNEVNDWLGQYRNESAVAQYDWIRYSTLDKIPAKQTEPVQTNEGNETVIAASNSTGKAASASLVSVKPTGKADADRSPEVAITVRIKKLPANARTLQSFIRTNRDWPADQVSTGGKPSGDFTFRAYVNSANPKSPFYINVLDDNDKVIGRIPSGEAMLQIPFPR